MAQRRWNSCGVWLTEHLAAGRQFLSHEQRKVLRQALLEDLAAPPAVRITPSVVRELRCFIDAGLVSHANLARLERRLHGCAGASGSDDEGSEYTAGPTSARDSSLSGGARTRSSRASRSTAGRGADVGSGGVSLSGAFSARLATPGSARASRGGTDVPGVRAPLATVAEVPPRDGGKRCSEAVDDTRAVEERERREKAERNKAKQQEMAQELKAQLDWKREQLRKDQEEDMQHFMTQSAELTRWKEEESQKAVLAKKKVMEIMRERDLQFQAVQKRMKDERDRNMQEDAALMTGALEELERERGRELARKAEKKSQQAQNMRQSCERRGDTGENRRARIELELKENKDFDDMLAEQEVRNRPVVLPIRGEQTVIKHPAKGRRGADTYTEENVMKQRQQAVAHAESLEKAKVKRMQELRQKHQEHLLKQMEERTQRKSQGEEQKQHAKILTQELLADFQEEEKRRMELEKMKNRSNRIELERQIATRKGRSEDDMISAKPIINRCIVFEAREA